MLPSPNQGRGLPQKPKDPNYNPMVFSSGQPKLVQSQIDFGEEHPLIAKDLNEEVEVEDFDPNQIPASIRMAQIHRVNPPIEPQGSKWVK